jgi:hypothetical protein
LRRLQAIRKAQPSDSYPDALHHPTDERKGFHLSATIDFNRPAVDVKETMHGLERGDIDQANDPKTAIARDGAPRRQHDL